MAEQLDALMKKTFIDNSIHTAMVIDDEFLTYEKLMNSIKGAYSPAQKQLLSSERSLSFEKFFSQKEILCTVDDGIAIFKDINKIKKSDLIVIDYFLEEQDPTKTLNLINEIRETENLNFVVIYTNEPIDTVFKDIAITFRGSYPSNEEELINDGLDEEMSQIREAIIGGNNFGLDDADINLYVSKFCDKELHEKIYQNLNKHFPLDKDKLDKLCFFVINESLRPYNRLSKQRTAVEIEFGKDGFNWIKSKNIFVCIMNKSPEQTDEAKVVWDYLSDCIVNWNPSYYQIMTSEIQNVIESKVFSFVEPLLNDSYSQAAWLNEILKNKSKESQQKNKNLIFDMFYESINSEIKSHLELNNFIDNVIESLSVKHAESGINSLSFSAKNMNIDDNEKSHYAMYHALNMDLSSWNYEEKNKITTGTVFTDEKDWYLCVSAACDMEPSQAGSTYASRLIENEKLFVHHKLIKAIKLRKRDVTRKYLKEAHQSKYIYVMDNKDRKIFDVYKDDNNVVDVDYMIIKDIDKPKKQMKATIFLLDCHGRKEGEKIEDGEMKMPEIILKEINIKIKSQLKVGYAERYQNFASNHSARIGVDYISFPIK